jgi:hypothetical protein
VLERLGHRHELPFDMPMPNSGVVGSTAVVAISCCWSRSSRARSAFAVAETWSTSHCLSPVRWVLSVAMKP